MYHELIAIPDRTASHVAQAYAAMVAMTLRDYSEWKGLVERLEVASLDWADRIRATARQNAVPTVVTELTASQARIAPITPVMSSTTEENVSVRPRIVTMDSNT
jgi:hypothetical protein